MLSATDSDIVLRFAAAILCGGAIGLERDLRRLPTGFRTMAIVCLGACIAGVAGLKTGDPSAFSRIAQGVGHYGVFNGTRWRTEIQPRIREFIRTINYKRLTGGEGTRIPRPYRVLSDTPDVAPDWRKKTNGSLNGANGKHSPSAAGE